MGFSLVIVNRPLKDLQPTGSYERNNKVYVSLRDNHVWRNGSSIRLSPQDRKIFCMLGARPGRVLSRNEIEDGLYADDITGGALGKIIGTRLFYMRRSLPAIGLEIRTRWGVGVSLEEAEAKCEEAE